MLLPDSERNSRYGKESTMQASGIKRGMTGALSARGGLETARTRLVAVAVTTALLCVLGIGPASGTAVAAEVKLYRPTVRCDQVGGRVYVVSRMDRIYPQGWEIWERQPWFRDKFSGRWIPGGPVSTSSMQPPGTVTIDLNNYPGQPTGYSLPRSHYDRVGMYYRWKYADPGQPWKVTAWQWVESPPRLSSGALTGFYYNISSHPSGHPVDECQTAETVVNIELD